MTVIMALMTNLQMILTSTSQEEFFSLRLIISAFTSQFVSSGNRQLLSEKKKSNIKPGQPAL